MWSFCFFFFFHLFTQVNPRKKDTQNALSLCHSTCPKSVLNLFLPTWLLPQFSCPAFTQQFKSETWCLLGLVCFSQLTFQLLHFVTVLRCSVLKTLPSTIPVTPCHLPAFLCGLVVFSPLAPLPSPVSKLYLEWTLHDMSLVLWLLSVFGASSSTSASSPKFFPRFKMPCVIWPLCHCSVAFSRIPVSC